MDSVVVPENKPVCSETTVSRTPLPKAITGVPLSFRLVSNTKIFFGKQTNAFVNNV
jgi:hypothetical protein